MEVTTRNLRSVTEALLNHPNNRGARPRPHDGLQLQGLGFLRLSRFQRQVLTTVQSVDAELQGLIASVAASKFGKVLRHGGTFNEDVATGMLHAMTDDRRREFIGESAGVVRLLAVADRAYALAQAIDELTETWISAADDLLAGLDQGDEFTNCSNATGAEFAPDECEAPEHSIDEEDAPGWRAPWDDVVAGVA